jgi:hypothetical protein
MQGATERTAPPRFGATCCFLDSPCRHFGCRRRFPFLAGYARDNPVYHVAVSPRFSASAATATDRSQLRKALAPAAAAGLAEALLRLGDPRGHRR